MKTLFTLLSLISVTVSYSQSGRWTWMKGDTTMENCFVDSFQGFPASVNNPGGRIGALAWQGLDSNLWMFGGNHHCPNYGGTDVYTAGGDLWKYSPRINQWTHVSGEIMSSVFYGTQGVASSANIMGGRYLSSTWTDKAGNLWTFGGNGRSETGVGYLNDVWNYNIATNRWTWWKGSKTNNATGSYGTKNIAATGNTPGARVGMASWKDTAGNLWIFGGSGFAVSQSFASLNDLWKYDIQSGNWTWVSGDNIDNTAGVYGTRGVPASTNKPGARTGSVGWIDSSNNLWLFGGAGFDAAGNYSYLNDLWKYNIGTDTWTWIKGDGLGDLTGTYGLPGVSSPSNLPRGRSYPSSWKDASGKVWIFGGSWDTNIYFSDRWTYNSIVNEWTWMGGDTIYNAPSVYTSQTSPTNIKPGGRFRSSVWTDITGNMWMYGGQQYLNGSLPMGRLGDLWRLSVDSANLPVHLLHFNGRLQQDKVNLNWQVENEQNFDRYEVERSYNGREFGKIGSVKWKVGIGDKHEYDYTDDGPWSIVHGLLFYRLKMLDKDGKFTYSNIEKVTVPDPKPLFTIYPNPASTDVRLQLNKTMMGKVTVEVVDATGKIVLSSRYDMAGTKITLTTQKLSAGNYNVRLLYNDEEYVQKLVIVK